MNPIPLLCAISDRNGAPRVGPVDLLKQAGRLASTGVSFFQLREKDLPVSELAALARAVLDVLAHSSTKLLINSRPDVAIAVRAHGVHLRSSPDELTASQIQQLYALAALPAPIVTVSCHTVEDVLRQRTQPLSAILFSPVFEKAVAGERVYDGTGLPLLRQACEAAAPLPVLALGGVTAANLSLCVEAGAQGVAGIRLFQ